MNNIECSNVVLEGGVPVPVVSVSEATDYQLMVALVPDIGARLKMSTPVVQEVLRRARDSKKGYRPLHWQRDCL